MERPDIAQESFTSGPDAADASPADDVPPGVGGHLTSMYSAYVRGRDRLITPYGLTANEFALLRCFIYRDEWTATQLTEILPAAASRISRFVDGLVKRGLLRRRRRSDDRRVVRLMLTDEGERVTHEIAGLVGEHEDRLMDGVTDDEREVSLRVLAKVMANAAALQAAAAD
ncbi:MAG: winged helix-turn-helix transcriptional regulator [Chloroflexi bacterium]|nr:winged helix-turn-helix transcriptional regulator [Chloroflexota bacterium]